WMLFEGALGLRWVAIGVTAAAAVIAAATATIAAVRGRRRHSLTLPPLEPSPDSGSPPAGYCRADDWPVSSRRRAIGRHVPGSGTDGPRSCPLSYATSKHVIPPTNA